MTTGGAAPPLRFAVVGDPVAHSRSPAMHEAAYRAHGLPHTYEALLTPEAALPAVVADLRRGVFAGLNVTVPHKVRVLALADEVDPLAARVGAANTLALRDGRVVAYNTDVPALAEELRDLAPERGARWASSHAVVLGAGGAARGAVVALVSSLGVARVTVVARRGAEALVAALRGTSNGTDLIAVSHPLQGAEGGLPPLDLSFADTLVQATSAGMTGASAGERLTDSLAWPTAPSGLVALDAVYAPPATPFLRAARQRGLRAESGLGMLAGQGALAFALWLGLPSPRDVMLQALVAAG